jgi:putative ABC transport system permease protein
MFAGMKAVAPAMKYNADQYYDRQNMMDIRVLSTLGLDEADIEAIEAVEGVETVQPGYSVDVITIRDAAEFVLRVHSLPSSAQDGDEYLNMPRLVEGRLPSGPGEAVVELNRNVDFPIALGDTITVSSGRVGTSRHTGALRVHGGGRMSRPTTSPTSASPRTSAAAGFTCS